MATVCQLNDGQPAKLHRQLPLGRWCLLAWAGSVARFAGVLAGGLECPLQRSSAAVVVGGLDEDGEEDVVGVAGGVVKVGGQLAQGRVQQFVVAPKPDGGLLRCGPGLGVGVAGDDGQQVGQGGQEGSPGR
jgi:hypothetical protein